MAEELVIHDLISRLIVVPMRITRSTYKLSEAAIYASPGQGEWSIAEIFGHMRAVDDLWVPRIYAMLLRDRPTLPAFDERHLATLVRYAEVNWDATLAFYALRRAELVGTLRRLEPEDWERVGLHEEYGEISLVHLVSEWVKHEEEHYAQIVALSELHR